MGRHLATWGTVAALALLFAGFSLFADNFLSAANLVNVVKQTTYLIVLATGFTIALLAAELDLSFANVCSLASVVCAGLMADWKQPVAVALLGALAVGVAFGLLNGIAVTRLRVPSLIATLATASVANGLAFLLTGGVAYVGRLPADFLSIGRGTILGVPTLIVWAGLILAVAWFVVKSTATGLHLIATGEAEEAAARAGIRTKRLKIAGLAISGLTAGAAAVMLTSALSSAGPTQAYDFLMRGIAATLLGMTTIEPGRPNLPGTLVGCLIIGLLTNGLVLMGAVYYVQDVVLGVIILGSVALSAAHLKRAAFGLK